jgi:putative transposase
MVYLSDITDNAWEHIKQYFDQKRVFGRPLKHSRRNIVNAIFYITKTGCQWRMLPKEFPPWETVYYYFKQWNLSGIWEEVLDILNKQDRLKQEREALPSYGIIDSQSVKTKYNSDERGIDGGKKDQRT